MKKQIEITHSKNIRFPESLWEQLAHYAKKNNRTIAGEIIYRLRKSLGHR